MTLLTAGVLYLAVGFVLWAHAWAEGATTHTLCGCGDPALFLWFFQWPATALAHGHNPFFSTALFHPTGINLLANTSVTGLSLPLVPVTWIWGPVASLNVASTLAPALTAFTAFVVIRRWAAWTPAAFVGGLLYGFSPFVLSSLEFAHLMTVALMLLPLILAVLDEILIRQRHGALGAGALLGLLLFGQFFLSSELLAIAAVVIVVCLVALLAVALVTNPAALRARLPHAAAALGIGLGLGAVLLAWPVWFALEGPAHLSGLVWPNVGVIGGFIPSSFVTTGYPSALHSFLPLSGYEGAPLASAAYIGWGFLAVMVVGLAVFWRDRRLWFFAFVFVVSRGVLAGRAPGPVGAGLDLHPDPPGAERDRAALHGLRLSGRRGAPGHHHGSDLPRRARLAGRPRRVGGERGRPRADGGHLQRAPALHHAGGGPAPLVQRGGADPAPRTGPPHVSRAVLGHSVGHGLAVGPRHALQPGGGGGPQGVERRAGTAAPGFEVLSDLGLGGLVPPPAGTPAQLAAVRHAMSVWNVNTVVVAPDRALSTRELGRDPVYAAAFMTAALGRQPTLEAGAWVWNDVQLRLHHAPAPQGGHAGHLLGGRRGEGRPLPGDHAASRMRRRGRQGAS